MCIPSKDLEVGEWDSCFKNNQWTDLSVLEILKTVGENCVDPFFYLLVLVMNRNLAVRAVLRTFVIEKKILKDVLEDANFSSSREFHYKSK